MSWKWGTNWFKKTKIQNLTVRQLLNTFHQALIKDNQKIFSSQDLNLQPFKRQPHKMVKHTQTIPWLAADELFECVWPFCGVGTQRVHHRHQAIGKPSELFQSAQLFLVVMNMNKRVTEYEMNHYRSSCLEVFYKKNVLKISPEKNFTSVPESLAQKRFWHRNVSENFAKFLRTYFV